MISTKLFTSTLFKYQHALKPLCLDAAKITTITCFSKNFSIKGRDSTKSTSNILEICKRLMCSQNSPPNTKLPPLMNFPEITWPSIIKSIRNFILSTFIVRPYMDKDFNVPDFVRGSKKALEVISHKLSEGDLKSLDGLVTKDIIPSLHKAISVMSLSQREQLAIAMGDIYFSFPYQVGIIFNDEEGKDQKRFVEITMVYHSMRGLSDMRARGEDPPINMGMVPEYQSRISICNYRFIREFSKGIEGEWTVNLLNHFKPADYIN